jgi:hypothetical protein
MAHTPLDLDGREVILPRVVLILSEALETPVGRLGFVDIENNFFRLRHPAVRTMGSMN